MSDKSVDLGELRPYRVTLSVAWEYLVLAESYEDAVSVEHAREAFNSEDAPSDEEWKITANETTLERLPRGWDSGSLLYGTAEEVTVYDVREALAERAVADLIVGMRVYDRRMDLFGKIEAVLDNGASLRRDLVACVKYEFPMSAEAYPREVRLGDLVEASKVGTGR